MGLLVVNVYAMSVKGGLRSRKVYAFIFEFINFRFGVWHNNNSQ